MKFMAKNEAKKLALMLAGFALIASALVLPAMATTKGKKQSSEISFAQADSDGGQSLITSEGEWVYYETAAKVTIVGQRFRLCSGIYKWGITTPYVDFYFLGYCQ